MWRANHVLLFLSRRCPGAVSNGGTKSAPALSAALQSSARGLTAGHQATFTWADADAQHAIAVARFDLGWIGVLGQAEHAPESAGEALLRINADVLALVFGCAQAPLPLPLSLPSPKVRLRSPAITSRPRSTVICSALASTPGASAMTSTASGVVLTLITG